LFFRLLKSVLGCRHLLSDSIEGVSIQVYAALIAVLLLTEYTGDFHDAEFGDFAVTEDGAGAFNLKGMAWIKVTRLTNSSPAWTFGRSLTLRTDA
jgi:hypothetical protein